MLKILKILNLNLDTYLTQKNLAKNIITSGCVIYPMSLTCSNYFDYYDSVKTNVVEISGEAWSKDWVNYEEKKYTIEDYNRNFNWIKTWSDNHLKKVIEKFGPFFLFVLLFSLIFIYILVYGYYKLKKEFNLGNVIILISIVSYIFIMIFDYPNSRVEHLFLLGVFISTLKSKKEINCFRHRIIIPKLAMLIILCFSLVITYFRIIGEYNNTKVLEARSNKDGSNVINFSKINNIFTSKDIFYIWFNM